MTISRYILSGMIGACTLIGAGAAQAASLKIACGTGPQEAYCEKIVKAWGEENGHTVETVSTPNSSTETLALYQQILAAQGADIDIFMIDVVWPGILGQHLVDLKPHTEGTEKNHFPAIVTNNTVGERLVGMPWFTAAGLLYYRKDLLEKHGEQVPSTWEALSTTAKKIQDAERAAGNDKMWGFVWQGRAYEGLTCDALEWVVSHNGGTIIDADGKITINNPQAVAALEQAASWVGSITPEGVLNYTEEEARGVFQAGNAVFMRNWPYAWALGQGEDSPIKGKIGVAPLPKGGADGRHAATLGGWQLAVSKYSENQEAAIALALYLTGPEIQKQRAIELSLLPTIEDLYKDKDVLEANPFFGDLYDVFVSAVARPATVTGSKYNQVSNEFWNATFNVLAGKSSGADSLAALSKKLKRLSRGGKW